MSVASIPKRASISDPSSSVQGFRGEDPTCSEHDAGSTPRHCTSSMRFKQYDGVDQDDARLEIGDQRHLALGLPPPRHRHDPSVLVPTADGSIRIPASFCGLVGVKPTYGSIDDEGRFRAFSPFISVGPLARCVAVSAARLHARLGSSTLWRLMVLRRDLPPDALPAGAAVVVRAGTAVEAAKHLLRAPPGQPEASAVTKALLASLDEGLEHAPAAWQERREALLASPERRRALEARPGFDQQGPPGTELRSLTGHDLGSLTVSFSIDDAISARAAAYCGG